jgi:tripartite-type tricarboxylate transporter receptor subunit TctC
MSAGEEIDLKENSKSPISMHHEIAVPQAMTRRVLAGAALSLSVARGAEAQQWRPNRPVRMLVPYTPGGGADTTARLFAQPFMAFLGQALVVENKPGAASTLGAGELARAAPDGLTLMLDAAGHTVAPFLIRGLPFDYATAFSPISQVTILPQMMLVRPDSPFENLSHVLSAAKAAPGKITFGSSGNGSAQHIAASVLSKRAGIQLTHVPYRGGGPALQSLLAGDMDFVIATVSSGAALVQEGRLRAVAAFSENRISSFPNLPTIAEQGFPGFNQNEWNGVWAPAGTPAPILQTVHAACINALADPAVKARLSALGAVPLGTSPDEFVAFLRRDREQNAQLIREAGITLD